METSVNTFGLKNIIEKKFAAIALSQQFPRLDMEGVMPYSLVRSKYACEVYDYLGRCGAATPQRLSIPSS